MRLFNGNVTSAVTVAVERLPRRPVIGDKSVSVRVDAAPVKRKPVKNVTRNSVAPAGAVADARDIAGARYIVSALRNLGGAVKLLTGEQATRAAVTQAFRDAAARARPGDAIVFSFAGHGVQEPEARPSEEVDGFDETLLFGGFRRSGPGTAQRLRDNEVAALFAEAAPGVSILFVVDACHSGAMTRALDPLGRQASVGLATLGQIFKDALPPAPGSLAMGPSLPDVLFIAAAAEHEQAPEVLIDGQSRGALSWARALEGAAGADPDALTPTAFARFARAQALLTPGPEPLRLGPAPITPPLGADLAVAVRCHCDLGDLAAMTAGRRADAGAFVAALRRRAERESMLIGVAAIYTWR